MGGLRNEREVGMIRDENILCISSIDWDFNWQGHQEIMSTFAEQGNNVLFIETTGVRSPRLRDLGRLKKRLLSCLNDSGGLRQIKERLWVYSPMPIPFGSLEWAGRWNGSILARLVKRWLSRHGSKEPIVWSFLPTRTSVELIQRIPRCLVVYYCIADFEQLVHNPESIRQSEKEMASLCDLLFVQGRVLKERLFSNGVPIHIFPFGVSWDVFGGFPHTGLKIPQELSSLKRPILGYVGAIHRHLDFKLLEFIAQERPSWSIVLVGPEIADASRLRRFPQVHFLGAKPFADLPRYIHGFDITLIPYLSTDYTKTVYPTKLNEYHAMGKPIVSTVLPEVEQYNETHGPLVYLATDPNRFLEKITEALEADNEHKRLLRVAAARENRWQKRIEEMAALMAGALEQKRNR